MMSEETVRGYLKNRRDTLKRQVDQFRDNLKHEVEYVEDKLENIPVELYPEVQKLLGQYLKLIDFMEGM
jgi:hypothetical protein